MQILTNVTVGDQYTAAATIEQVQLSNGGYFLIQNNDCFMQLQYNINGQLHWTREIHVPTGSGQIYPGTTGIRFRNYVAGSAAILSAALSENKEPAISIGASGVANVGGASSVVQLAYTEFNATFAATSTAEGSAVSVVSAGSVTFDGLTKVLIEVFAPRFTSDNNSPGDGGYLALFDTLIGSPVGRVAFGQTAGQGGPLIMRRFLTPSAGSHTYFAGIYDAGTASTHATISGGAGGATTLIPGYIRITSGS